MYIAIVTLLIAVTVTTMMVVANLTTKRMRTQRELINLLKERAGIVGYAILDGDTLRIEGMHDGYKMWTELSYSENHRCFVSSMHLPIANYINDDEVLEFAYVLFDKTQIYNPRTNKTETLLAVK